jgi:hypothetical protein
MNRQPVTLHAHDSINLSTGVVTRSSQSQSCEHLILVAHRQGLAMNDLETLHSAIKVNALHGTLGLYSKIFGDVYPADPRVCVDYHE